MYAQQALVSEYLKTPPGFRKINFDLTRSVRQLSWVISKGDCFNGLLNSRNCANVSPLKCKDD